MAITPRRLARFDFWRLHRRTVSLYTKLKFAIVQGLINIVSRAPASQYLLASQVITFTLTVKVYVKIQM